MTATPQVNAHRSLKLLNLLRGRRLADVPALGPQGHAAGLGHGVENGQGVHIPANNLRLLIR